MTAAQSPPVIRFSSAADIVGMVPWLVGFRPTDSLVVVCLREPRKRIGLTMRLDLEHPRHDADVAADVAARVRHDGAVAAIVVCWSDAPDDPPLEVPEGTPNAASNAAPAPVLPRQALVDAVTERLEAAGIPVVQALLARGDRWWSYTCDGACCPREGTPLPDRPSSALARLAAERALHGETVLADRAELARSVAGPALLRALEAEQAFDLVAAEMVAQRRDDALAQATLQQGTKALVRTVLDRYLAGTPEVGAAEAARISLGLFDKSVRDEISTWALDGEQEPALLGLLTAVARLTPDPVCAAVCALLGWVAYLRGNGALAAVAAERAVAAEPDYTLARLILDGLDRQVPPSAVRTVVRQHAEDLAAGTVPVQRGRAGRRRRRQAHRRAG